jgi:hypothetical protein
MNDGNLQRSKLLCYTTVLELIKRAFIPAIGVFTPRSARIFNTWQIKGNCKFFPPLKLTNERQDVLFHMWIAVNNEKGWLRVH